MTIRKFSRDLTSIDDLIERKTLNKQMAAFLIAAIKARLNIIFCGSTGSGKTTLLNVLSRHIPEHERTPTNTKHLNTLIKAERTADRAASAQRAAKKIFTEEQAKKRKERTHKLVQLGALFEIANLDNHNPAELLGILLKTSELPQDDPKLALWREYGQQTLNQRKDTKK